MSDDTIAMLADAASAFAKPDAKRIRAQRASGTGVDRRRWREMAELGWYSMLVPEEQGGLGLSAVAATTVAQRVGYAAFPEPFVAAGVVMPWLLAGLGAAGANSLASVLDGSQVLALAWQDAEGRLDPTRPGVVAGTGAGGVRLSGDSRFVVPGDADGFIVAARLADSIGLYRIARDQQGLSVRIEARADGTGSGWLSLSNAPVPEGACLASGPSAASLLRTALDLGVLASSAELVGLMDRALEMTLDYLRTRKQFGKPIGSFQALQHRTVDIWIQLKLARAVLEASVSRFDRPGATEHERSMAASSAKARAAHAALLLCNQAVQLHGAIGFTDEYDLGLYLNRVLTVSGWLGNAREHRLRYGMLSARQGA